MKQVLIGAIAAFLSVGSALAHTAMPPVLDKVLTEAEATPATRISYTMRFTWRDEAPVTLRYDADEKEWSALDGDPKALPRTAQKKLKNVKKSESTPGGLLYADFRDYLRDVRPLGTEKDETVLTFRPKQVDADEMTADGQANVQARLYVDQDTNTLRRYEVIGLHPFKPNMATKMEAFEVIQDFERLGDDGPAVLVRLKSVQKGERLFKEIDTDFVATFSDFEIVD